MSYSEDYRKVVIEYRLEGNILKETSKIFKVSESAIKSWVKQYKTTGNMKKKPSSPRKHKKIDPVKLESYVKEHPDAYLYEMAEYFNCSIEGVRLALKRLKITRKKRNKIY